MPFTKAGICDDSEEDFKPAELAEAGIDATTFVDRDYKAVGICEVPGWCLYCDAL